MSIPWDHANPSLWPPLTGDLEVEVCVVGGGIAGITTAYLLAAEGVDVALIEAGEIGGGETAHTSAHLASALDDRFCELSRLHGAEGAALAYRSHAAAIERMEQLASELGIECGFARVPGYLFAGSRPSGPSLREEQLAAVRAGLPAELLDRVPGCAFDTGPCLRFPRQAQFQPLHYLHGLAAAAATLGVAIHSRTRARDIRGGAHPQVTTGTGRRILARAVVVATNVPVNDRFSMHPWLEPQRSYVISLAIPAEDFPRALLWDDEDPYHYLRTCGDADGGTVLLVGGEDHPTGIGDNAPDGPYERLERWTRDRFPSAGPTRQRWSGQIIEPVDGLALIGRNPADEDGVFIITGDSGNGLTHGTLGAMLVCDLIQGRSNPWERLYRPSRFPFPAVTEFARHNAEVLARYADWLKPAEVASLADIPRAQAALVRHGAGKLAAYRDAEGRLHVCSAVCPHLGGLVRWNARELSWDCPCHGSRFAIDGTVLNGPANDGLASIPGGGPAS
jgi:glycine/D-amino acid oxidase-like deaminating enzyme/nitrite reductase/ring-hydroxylating ferredoxin subunit